MSQFAIPHHHQQWHRVRTGITAFFMLAAYSLIKPLKLTLLTLITPQVSLPLTYVISALIYIPLLFIYEYLITKYSPSYLLRWCLITYAIGSLAWAGYFAFNSHYSTALCMCFYVYAELCAFFTLTPFWMALNNTTSMPDAKKWYGLFICLGQLGSLASSLCSGFLSAHTFAPQANLLACFFCLLLALIATMADSSTKKEEVPPSWDKSRLLAAMRHPFMLGMLGLVVSYEVIATFLETTMLARLYTQHHGVLSSIHSHTMWYAGTLQAIALLVALLSMTNWMASWRITTRLMVLPTLSGLFLGICWFSSNIIALTIALICMKGLFYAIDSPARQMLYIPTTPLIRQQGKLCISSYGKKLARALGTALCFVTSYFTIGSNLPISVLAILGFILCVWLLSAFYMGMSCEQALSETPGENIGLQKAD